MVTFSGDKLLGGPQAGSIVGRKEFIARDQKKSLQACLASRKTDACGIECDLTAVSSDTRFACRVSDLRWLTRAQEEMDTIAVQVIPLLQAAIR